MIPVYQVDAFTTQKYKGNPAAVCPLDSWLDDKILQKIAEEINLSETAFFVPQGDDFLLRWFTPTTEVRLCGHATLATSHVLFHHLNYQKSEINFKTNRAGKLKVSKKGAAYQMDFPSDKPKEIEAESVSHLVEPDVLHASFGTDDLILQVKDRTDVLNCQPDLLTMLRLKYRAVIVTAKDDEFDFVSRVFAPAVGIDEDPVTGSAYTTLTPYWSEKLNKNTFNAAQISKRGGELKCTLIDDRVMLEGSAITTIEGKLL